MMAEPRNRQQRIRRKRADGWPVSRKGKVIDVSKDDDIGWVSSSGFGEEYAVTEERVDAYFAPEVARIRHDRLG